MKTLATGALIVLGALLAALLAAPGFINWNEHRAEIARRLSEAVGQAVSLDGDVSLTLLPSPAFSVHDARIAGAAGMETASLRRLDVKVALLPLLSGRIKVESVTLVAPVVVVEMGADGRLIGPWPWDPAPGRPALAPLSGRLGEALSFELVAVEDGTVVYRDRAAGPEERVRSIDAAIVAGSLVGPFQVKADVTLRGAPLRLEATAGRFAADAAVPLRASLVHDGSGATARFAGN